MAVVPFYITLES